MDYLHDCGLELSVCDKNGATPLHYAVHASDDVPKEQSQRIVKMLLSKQVKVDTVDEDKRTPLIWAASSGEWVLLCVVLGNRSKCMFLAWVVLFWLYVAVSDVLGIVVGVEDGWMGVFGVFNGCCGWVL